MQDFVSSDSWDENGKKPSKVGKWIRKKEKNKANPKKIKKEKNKANPKKIKILIKLIRDGKDSSHSHTHTSHFYRSVVRAHGIWEEKFGCFSHMIENKK